MSAKKQVVEDRIKALKAGDSATKSVLDYVLGEIQKKEKDPNPPKGDIAIATIKAHVKSLEAFIDQYSQERPEACEAYRKEIELLAKYLPTQVDEATVEAAVNEIIASGESNQGKIMRALKERFGDSIDMKLAGGIVARVLKG